MCIIIAKPRGKDLPSREIFKICFDKNKDGAGFMYPFEDKIHIEKGFMNFEAFYGAIETAVEKKRITIENPAVFHCRIRTTGATNPGNTHPFPVSNKIGDLRATKITTDLGIAHNGMIDIKTGNTNSDTQEFTKKILSKLIPKIMEQDKATHTTIKDAGGISRFCFLTVERMTMLGNWEDSDGIFYSNSGYKKTVWPIYKEHNYNKPVPRTTTIPYVFDKELQNVMGSMFQDFWGFFITFDCDFDRALYATYAKYKYRISLFEIDRSVHGRTY